MMFQVATQVDLITEMILFANELDTATARHYGTLTGERRYKKRHCGHFRISWVNVNDRGEPRKLRMNTSERCTIL